MGTWKWASLLGVLLLVSSEPAAARNRPSSGGALQPSPQMRLAVTGFAPECDPLFSAAVDPNRTVFERADASRALKSCLELRRANEASAAATSRQPAGEAMALQLQAETLIEEAQTLQKANEAGADFLQLGWGLGFGFSFGADDHVESAAVVDGLIRVTEDRTDQPRLVLEFHRYFWCNEKGTDGYKGCGPFVAVAANQDKILSGVGVGFMFGARPRTSTSPEGFSVGIGGILDGKIKSLANGFEADQPLPSGESGIRYEEKARWSYLVFVTRSF